MPMKGSRRLKADSLCTRYPHHGMECAALDPSTRPELTRSWKLWERLAEVGSAKCDIPEITVLLLARRSRSSPDRISVKGISPGYAVALSPNFISCMFSDLMYIDMRRFCSIE